MPFEFYIIIGITLAALGILCFIKNIKEGVIASCAGGIICIIVFIIHYIYYITNNFFESTGISIKDIFSYILCIAITCLVFIGIILVIKFLGIKKR